MQRKLFLFFSIWLQFYVAVYAIHYSGLDVLRPFSSAEKQEAAVADLIGRVFGADYKNQFQLTVDLTLGNDTDVVIFDRGPNETTKIVGSSGVVVAWGVQQYLRNCCGIHISWDGNQIKTLPQKLPHPANRYSHHSIGRLRYYSNVCTFSYSFVWWGWPEWEKHLDWLALNGINLPLASVGMEAIWQRVYKKLGLTQEDIDAYFTGPAFLAWRRMGNLKNWAGPLSQNWHAMQLDLQHQILDRMVELGMVPVLPTFAGHVPDAIERLYPQTNITILRWNSFNCSYTCIRFIEPTDPMFQRIGEMFMTEMKNEYGLFHAYSADPFNEMKPRSYDKNYLTTVGQAIYNSMATTDPDAVWVMQGWMFVGDSNWQKNDAAKSFLLSVPIGKLLILDLYSEQIPVYQLFESFYGQPYIWNVLQNFGGIQGLFGAVSKLNEFLLDAINFPNSTLVGVGLTMEGIFQNYPIYQFALDRAWSKRQTLMNQTVWISHYARQRYGSYDDYLENAWQNLWATVYDQSDTPNWHPTGVRSTFPPVNSFHHLHHSKSKAPLTIHDAHISPMTSRPTLTMATQPGYDPQALCQSWKNFLYNSEKFKWNDLYNLDVVDITREVLMMIAANNYRLLVKAFQKNDTESLMKYGINLLQNFDDVNEILLTHKRFLFGDWQRQAHAKSKNDAERNQYEYNLRNQLTLWGPNGEILDYARKEWHGLIKDYYKPRWELFVNLLLEHLLDSKGTPFNQQIFNKIVFTMIEQPFTFQTNPYPSDPVGDSSALAHQFFDTYFQQCQAVA